MTEGYVQGAAVAMPAFRRAHVERAQALSNFGISQTL